ncbi:hypothetical protein [Kibdelosporangium phytohabitans]|uniref:PE domain-containing protein n=1 Tax=Kibdelosporangium phytohabitans TaxID=860235 RepID=A0A0N9IEP5_9PSEU|nr:hypothetical protein [Kibdelosporangium phytohabitans]ALG13254.1 hypothetical protein AOZ06_46060 [Kibdelosporangium phytohabitans]MBE1465025.1 hypothetical protein [Kibdelosporangium phytohabitans]
MSGYTIDLGAMNNAYSGIKDTLGQLRELGIKGMEESGESIESLELDEDVTGHEAISDRVEEVLMRAHYALRDLLDDGDDILDKLKETLSVYQKMETEATSGFEQLWGVFEDTVTMRSPRGGAQ